MPHPSPTVIVSLFGVLLAATCSDDSSSPSHPDAAGALDAAAADAPTAPADASSAVHAVTSATPLVKDITLSATHKGWKKADCASCHERNHDSDYPPAACAHCHGANGAPGRSRANHPAYLNCADCHTKRHVGLGFTQADCLACHAYPSGKTCGFTDSYDVVVVGAGGGGLAAAATLALAGKKVVVLEKSFKVGGCMGNFRRGPFRFEASLHGFDGLVEGAGMNVAIFKKLGIWDRLEILRPDPMFRVAYPDFTWDIPADPDAYQKFLREKFPAEAKGIDALFAEMRDLHRILREVIQSQATGAAPNVTSADLTKLQGYTSKTLMEVLDLYIKDPKLVAVWTQLSGFAGAEPKAVSAVFFIAMWSSYYLGGYHYFKGGSEALAEALAAATRDNGGAIRTGSLVTEIVVAGGLAKQVRTADGGCYDASYVISNASAPTTVHDLVGDDKFPADYVAKLKAMKVGLSAFVVYLGVDRDYSQQFKGAHEIMVGTGYDTSAPFKAIHDCAPDKLPYTIVNTTLVDPETAPAGKNVIILTSQLAYECNDEWQWDKSRAGYKAYKEQLAQAFIKRAETFLPDLSKHVEVMEVATPLTIKGYTLNPRGSIFGWDNTPGQSTLSRLAQQTPISNLYLAGAWTFPGGGQSAVIISGTIAAQAILGAMATP